MRSDLRTRPVKMAGLGWCCWFWLVGGSLAQNPPAAPAAPPDPAPAPAAGRTASELFGDAKSAFANREFEKADALFAEFVETYKDEPQVAAAVAEIQPLRALAKVRLKKFADALPLVETALADPKTPPEVADELAFWLGLCLMQGKDFLGAQVAFGEFYRDRKTRRDQRARCHEALLLFGVCNTLLGEHADAAEFLSWQMPRLRRESKEAAARATVLLLYSLMESGEHDAALDFVREQYADIGSVTQLISFQSLTLDLGSRFLDAGEHRKAIACLQRVWKRDRLLEHQRERLADLDDKLAILRARGLDEFIFQYDGMRRRVEKEIASFEAIPNFDAALRLRLATAFQGLRRYREAALVMEDMLRTMEPDEVVAGATVTLIQCWMEIERWPRAAAAADTFVARFGEDKGGETLPVVLFLKGRALHSWGKHVEALELFREIYRRFPDSGVAGNALFMQGIVSLSLEQNAGAIALFEDMRRELPDHALAEDAFYWQGMGHSFAGEHEVSREHLGQYLGVYPSGRYRPDAVFRRAFATFSLADYPAANSELRAYLETYAGDGYNDEARLLLGDGLLAVGEIEAGVASYKSISPESRRFFEDGWFKVGKALKLQKKYAELRAHFEEFVERFPESRRMAEAVYRIGEAHRVEGAEAEAREIYWATIREHGDRAELFGIADLFDGLRKLYRGDDRREYLDNLAKLASTARSEDQPTLELHSRWAAASAAGASTAIGIQGFSRAAELCDPEIHNPRILADCADYLLGDGQEEAADKLFADLRMWHPRAVERDRAFLGRARIAMGNGLAESALGYIARLEEETPYSPRVADAKLLKAKLLAAGGQGGEALAVLDELLADKALPSAAKAEALFESAQILAAQGEDLKATAYFERVYVAYGKYRDLVARSYLRRGELLLGIDRREAAVEVFRELAAREDLAGLPERVEARKRLQAMGEDIDA